VPAYGTLENCIVDYVLIKGSLFGLDIIVQDMQSVENITTKAS